MQDVADQLGVSKMTVSAVLGGSSAHVRVSAETRARVLEAARQMHYRPNAVARSLRRQRTNVVGLYSGYGYLDARNPFLAEIIGGLQEGCDQHRKDLLLHGVFEGRDVDDIYAELVDGRIDGLALNAPPDDPLVDRLAKSHLPVIAIVDAVAALPSVVADDAAGTRLLVDYLARQGHRRLLFRGWERPMESVLRRRKTFFEAAAAHGLEAMDWIVPQWIAPPHASLTNALHVPWLDLPPYRRPTAVFCWNDLAAYDLLAYCRLRGVRVPDDLAVVGFDGFASPLGATARLTSIRAPWPEVARTAVSLLVERINGQEIPQETVLPVHFVAGDTA
jgi:DNA-binding LacI/PurR family transcriptional regulator